MKKKIVYMGTPDYAQEILASLIEAEDMHVCLVVTQPDKPVGRKRVLTPPSVKVLALEYEIEVLQPHRLRDEGIKEQIEAMYPDFIIVAAFGQILPRDILDIAPCINLHASRLPQYRGASPVQQSLLNADKTSGVTSMLMEEGLDTGDILEMSEFIIPKEMRLQGLMKQLTQDACDLTLSTIRNFESITAIKQDETKATLCKKIKKTDGKIAFENAEYIYRKYRAFEGWPSIFDKNGMKFDDIRVIDTIVGHEAGEILGYELGGVLVGCSKGTLLIKTFQPASKKPMLAKAYCKGRGLKIGNTIL